MSENRKRSQTLTIRVTAGEKDAITQKAAKARMSVTDYIVASAQINAGAFQSYNFQEVIEMQRSIYEALLRIGGGQWRP